MTGRKPFLGIGRRTWILAAILVAFSAFVYTIRVPQTPNAFDQPGAEQPNRLRSPWGVENPL